MPCNPYRNISTFLFIALAVSSCTGQDPLKEILRRPEEYQRAFVAAFLQSPSCEMEGYPRTSSQCDDFRLLVDAKDWVLPLAEVSMKEWLLDPKANKKNIDFVVSLIAYVRANTAALDFIAHTFRDSRDLGKWLGMALRSALGVPDPNFITYYYYALESKNPAIRAAAQEWVPVMLNNPNPATLQTWGEGLIFRYGHEPSTLELLTDPVLKIVRAGSRMHSEIGGKMHPEVLQRSLAEYAKKAFEDKQSKKKP